MGNDRAGELLDFPRRSIIPGRKNRGNGAYAFVRSATDNLVPRCDVHGCLPDIILRDFFAGEKTLLKVHGTLRKLFNSLPFLFFFFDTGFSAVCYRLPREPSKHQGSIVSQLRARIKCWNFTLRSRTRLVDENFVLSLHFFFFLSTFVGKLRRWETVVCVGSNVCRLIREAIKREWKEWYIHATVSLSEKRCCLRWFTWPSGRQLEPLNEMSVHHGN